MTKDKQKEKGTTEVATWIIVASVISASCTFLIQWLVGRWTSPEVFSEFLVFWSLLFGVIGIVAGIQNEATRAVGRRLLKDTDEGSVRVLTTGLIIGCVVCLLALISSPLWVQRLVPTTSPWVVLVIAVALIAYSGHATFSGASAGQERWGLFASLMAMESFGRFIFCMVALLAASSLLPLEIAAASAASIWLFFLVPSRRNRQTANLRSDVSTGRLLRNYLLAMLSSASSALLITGFPVLLRLTSPEVKPEVLGATIFAISITRSPIMIPLQAFQGFAITKFLRSSGSGVRALLVAIVALLGFGALAMLAGYFLGPWIIDLLFSGKYQVSGWLIAGLLIAATMLAILTLTGTATIAGAQHKAYAAGWLLASVVALSLLFMPLGIETRVLISLIAGPVSGVLIHLVAIQVKLKVK